MTEKINWHKELLESGKFNDKFSKNLLEHGAKNFMQGIYLGYMYSRWRRIRGLDKDAWRLGVLHVEYERLKKMQEEQQQQ